VEDEQVDVAARRQLTAAVPPDGDERDAPVRQA
jgi:hypothetical protein